MSNGRVVSAALEDYLEAILRLDREKGGSARVRDIAAALSVHKSTVTSALKNLAKKGLVDYKPYEPARLTPDGRRIAEEIAERHGIIKGFLTEVLLVPDEVAGENACRMEHVVDREVMERLVLLARFAKRPSRARTKWLERFATYVVDKGKEAKA